MSQEFIIPLTVRVSLGESREVKIPPGVAPQDTTAGARKKPGKGRENGVSEEAATENVFQAYQDKFSISSLGFRSFDWSTALSLALAAKLAYSPEAEVKRVVKRWGLGNCVFLDEDDTQCFIASSPDLVLIAFRGSESVGDWLANMNMIGTSRPYGRMHRGFMAGFKIVESQLLAELRNHPGKKVVLTGHSLGGALAVIAAAEWEKESLIRITWIHTCGQPAVGRSGFRDFFNDRYDGRYHRIVNDRDVVPMVPPLYQHAGELIHFSEDGGLENALGGEELESLDVDLGTIDQETPMMSEPEFDELRARLLLERAGRAGSTLDDSSLDDAIQETAGEEGLEGFLPSAFDHPMDRYLEKIARKAGH